MPCYLRNELKNLVVPWNFNAFFISYIFSSAITAYYNPDEDEANAAEKKTSKNALGLDAGAGFVGGDRKNSEIIVNQPLARHCSVLG